MDYMDYMDYRLLGVIYVYSIKWAILHNYQRVSGLVHPVYK